MKIPNLYPKIVYCIYKRRLTGPDIDMYVGSEQICRFCADIECRTERLSTYNKGKLIGCTGFKPEEKYKQ